MCRSFTFDEECLLGSFHDGVVDDSENGQIYHVACADFHFLSWMPVSIQAGSTHSSSPAAASVLWDGLLDAFWHSEPRRHPWIQIELAGQHWVDQIKISLGTGTSSSRHSHLEVRVGNEDVLASADGDTEMLCANQLCSRSGASQEAIQSLDCSALLEGKFVSVQKYDQVDSTASSFVLEVAEVEIHGVPSMFYCPNQSEAPSCPVETWLDQCSLISDCSSKYAIFLTFPSFK